MGRRIRWLGRSLLHDFRFVPWPMRVRRAHAPATRRTRPQGMAFIAAWNLWLVPWRSVLGAHVVFRVAVCVVLRASPTLGVVTGRAGHWTDISIYAHIYSFCS